MGWREMDKSEELKPRVAREETNWDSAYADSFDYWHSGLTPYYNLVGVYELDEEHKLYRFQIDESRRAEIVPWSPNFHNVTIHHPKKK